MARAYETMAVQEMLSRPDRGKIPEEKAAEIAELFGIDLNALPAEPPYQVTGKNARMIVLYSPEEVQALILNDRWKGDHDHS